MTVAAGLRALARESLRPLAARFAPHREDLPPELWGLARGAGGELEYEGVRLSELVEVYGSPLHVVLPRSLRENAAAFLSAPSDDAVAWRIYYSYKTNPVPGVLAELHRAGIGAEVISEYELWLALRLGVSPADIVYNGPAKSDASLVTAIENDILVNLNSHGEIERVARLAARLGRRARVGIRVATDDAWAGQFGFTIAGGAAVEAYRHALGQPSLEVVGIHAHRGNTITTVAELEGFAAAVLGFVRDLEAEPGIELTVLNFGGSLPCPSSAPIPSREYRLNRAFGTDLRPPDPAMRLSPRAAVRTVDRLVREAFGNSGLRRQVCFEPGRALTGNTQLLLTRVLDVRHDTTPAYAIVDAGINVAEPMRSEYHQVFYAGQPRGGAPRRTYRIAGPICTPGDVVCNAWEFPELQRGDVLAFMDTGAYFVPFSTSFSFPRPPIVAIDGGAVTLLRRAERFEDLAARDVAAQAVTL